ncbi:Rrf2 family transcriptional regulator [Acidicapsa ligni]|uniref:Rrf2 family transcriptional regulator n=1 Tax=Acidicapsa ligni TaxID=542300 RepID=UPI0021DF8E16|nr:Rrf2 family transcriptional regulator [Acidicapsa ligni]
MNSKFSIAVHVLSLLASTPGERQTSEFLAISIGTNPVVIRRLLANLRRAGLVTSKSAGGGGWMLTLPSDQLTLDRVRQAVSEGESAKMHRNQPHPACAVGKDVRRVLGDVYKRADKAVDRELAQISIAAILASALQEEQSLEASINPQSFRTAACI